MLPIIPLKMDVHHLALTCGELTKSSFGGFFENIASQVFQTPVLKCAGASVFGDDKKKIYLSVSPDESMIAFMEALDAQLIAICKSHWEAWFRRQFTDADEACFCRSVSLSDTGAIFKFALQDSKTCITEIFDHDNQAIPQDAVMSIAQGASVACLLQLEGLWFSRGRFGPRIKVMQVKLYTNPAGIK